MLNKTLAPLGAVFLSAATALNLAERHDTPSTTTTTTTIPYLGSCDSTTTITPCPDQVTVVIQTPIGAPVCTNAVTTISTTASPTTTSSTPTTISTISTTVSPITTRCATSSSTTSTKPCTSSTPKPIPTAGGPCVLLNPLCPPVGLDIDYYANAFYGYSSGNTPSSYYITEGLSPKDSSLTNVTFFPQDTGADGNGLPRIYPDPAHPGGAYLVGWTRSTNGGVTVDANNFTLVYQGFYRAPKTGTYNICSTADNENDVFFGHGNAFSCIDGRPSAAAKPLLVTTGGYFQNGLVCKNFDLVAGLYYPVRNVMGNHQGPSAFNFTIQEPGVAFEKRTNDLTGLVYPHKCGIFL